MLEQLIQNSILLSVEKKKMLLEKIKSSSPDYKNRLEKLLREEGDMIKLLFKKYIEETGEQGMVQLRGFSGSFEMRLVREAEAKEEMLEEKISI